MKRKKSIRERLVELLREGKIDVFNRYRKYTKYKAFNLSYAFLNYADLKNVKFRNADLRNVFLNNTNLRDADLRNTDFRNAFLKNADLRNCKLKNAGFRNADLENVNLKNTDLENAGFRNTDLKSADLSYTNLEKVNLKSANLENANLKGANIDFSCLEFSYKSLKVKFDQRHIIQILAHACIPTMHNDLGLDEDVEKLLNSKMMQKVLAKAHRKELREFKGTYKKLKEIKKNTKEV